MGSMVHGQAVSGPRNRPLTIVDTMGICDTKIDWEEQKFNIGDAITMCPEGFDVIFFVVVSRGYCSSRWETKLRMKLLTETD